MSFNFLPQVPQVKVDCAVKTIVVRPADPFHQCLAAKCPARGTGKRFKEFELLGREVHRFPREPGLVRLQIDYQISKMQCCWAFFDW